MIFRESLKSENPLLGMAHCPRPLSWTLSLLALAILVHLIVMTSLAERGDEGVSRNKRSVEGSKRHRNADNSVPPGSSPARGAIFATENSTVVIAQTGSTATLPCVVRKFGTGVVSWIRRKDYHLLTVGLTTYSSDDRFLVEHARHLQNWGLQIKFVQESDEGMYECQVTTHPPASIFVELKVIEAAAEIIGAPDLHIKSGSVLRLVCTLRQSTEPPIYVFWYHGERMINYDKERGVTVRSDRKSSVLTIAAADKVDSGNYTCVPSNAHPASINVHVLNGEKPAAMQHGGRSCSEPLLPTGRQYSKIFFCLDILVFFLLSR
ncbi:limbic system-associated membrane protein-like [Lycorma delicatula]|uniref:limbic system-associated membrane protein-like n=1 Tax=Lycorma delicatula TaxID=130591 RepID=UPI003F5140BA